MRILYFNLFLIFFGACSSNPKYPPNPNPNLIKIKRLEEEGNKLEQASLLLIEKTKIIIKEN